MIRLKQKKAEEGKKAAENQAEMNSSIPTEGAATTATMATNNAISDTNISENDASNSSSGGGLKLLGIGGKSTRTNGEGIKTTGKKKTPGEIRIQKGKF